VAQSTQLLGEVCYLQGDLTLAEKLFEEAETIHGRRDNRSGLAQCAFGFGVMRNDQGRRGEAIAQFRSAHTLYEELRMEYETKTCLEWIAKLDL